MEIGKTGTAFVLIKREYLKDRKSPIVDTVLCVLTNPGATEKFDKYMEEIDSSLCTYEVDGDFYPVAFIRPVPIL